MVVPACGDEPIEGWFKVLNPVLYPTEDARRRSQPAPGCPAFGEESVLERGPRGNRPPAAPSGPVCTCEAGWRTGRVVGSGRPCPRGRGARAAAAPAHPRGRCGRRCRCGERAELCGVEGGARGAARKGLRAVAVCPDPYVARPLRGREGCRRRDRRKRFGFGPPR